MLVLQWAWALLPYFNLAALVALMIYAERMRRRLREVVKVVEDRNRQWETIEALKKEFAICPVCGQPAPHVEALTTDAVH